MGESARSLLTRLESVLSGYGPGSGARKRHLLAPLAHRGLSSAEEVARLHECLCFLAAYPDDVATHRLAHRLLARFQDRTDLSRFSGSLQDSGIAGTEVGYRFYWPTARWLASRWPQRLSVDWASWDNRRYLADLLPLLLPYAESPGLDEIDRGPAEWIETLRHPAETDATFLVDRMARLAGDEFSRERTYDLLDVPLRLEPGPDTPARGRDFFPVEQVHHQTAPLSRQRPDLIQEVERPPLSVEPLPPARARQLCDLSRAAMVTRSRDLDGFANADPNDARWVDCGDGLAFGLLGLRPQRRLMLESSYAALTMKNGVPLGYVLISALYGSAAIAYNVFDTFRGAEAARIFGRVLALGRSLFGADTFSIDPYQLGYGNAEGLASGAWWFYYKLGFRPHDAETQALANAELRQMRRDPGHRSSIETLEQLASATMYLHTGEPRDDVLGEIPLGQIGLAVSRWLARNYGADRERGLRECSARAAESLQLRSLAGLSPAQKLWWRRWSPLVCALPRLGRWRAANRRALARIILAKGGRHESDFVPLFDAHRHLRRALLRLAE